MYGKFYVGVGLIFLQSYKRYGRGLVIVKNKESYVRFFLFFSSFYWV